MENERISCVFSDLDGTLLDHHTYSYAESLPGIDLLRERKIPLVLVSSKTLPEMTILHAELKLDSPLIFENGGGIAFPVFTDTGIHDCRIEYSGLDVNELYRKKPLLEEIINRSIRTIVDMDTKEIMGMTGLDRESAERSRQRSASIPFVVSDGPALGPETTQTINARLSQFDLTITRGGRFYHFSSSTATKGFAARRIIRFYSKTLGEKEIISMGIGDSGNDIPLLQAVDYPVLVRRYDGSHLESDINAYKTDGIGPAGFTEAVHRFIS